MLGISNKFFYNRFYKTVVFKSRSKFAWESTEDSSSSRQSNEHDHHKKMHVITVTKVKKGKRNSTYHSDYNSISLNGLNTFLFLKLPHSYGLKFIGVKTHQHSHESSDGKCHRDKKHHCEKTKTDWGSSKHKLNLIRVLTHNQRYFPVPCQRYCSNYVF